jgi:uncharacterized membrane-anchored protein
LLIGERKRREEKKRKKKTRRRTRRKKNTAMVLAYHGCKVALKADKMVYTGQKHKTVNNSTQHDHIVQQTIQEAKQGMQHSFHTKYGGTVSNGNKSNKKVAIHCTQAS